MTRGIRTMGTTALALAVSALTLAGAGAAGQAGPPDAEARERMRQHMREMTEEDAHRRMHERMHGPMRGGMTGDDMMRGGMMGPGDDRSMPGRRGDRMDRQVPGMTGRQGMMGQGMMDHRAGREIPREFQQIRGTVREVRRVRLRDHEQRATLALIATEQGPPVVADLGTTPEIPVRPGEEIAVRGRPVLVQDRGVVWQADAVRYAGRSFDVNRPARRRGGDTIGSPAAPAHPPEGQPAGRAVTAPEGGGRERGGPGPRLGRFDTNGDDRFSLREMVNALDAEFDRNRDGALTLAEWARGMGRAFRGEEARLNPDRWDRDGDGQISRAEFRNGMRRSGLFDRIDQDDSGEVDRAEVRAFAGIGPTRSGDPAGAGGGG